MELVVHSLAGELPQNTTSCSAFTDNVVIRLPMNTEREYDIINSSVSTLSYFSVTSCSILLWIWLADKKRRQQILVILFAATAMISSIVMAISFNANENARCANNAVGVDETDGFNFCSFASFVNNYSFTATSFAWSLQAVDVNLKVVWNMKTERYLWLYVAIVLLGPLYTVVFFGVYGMWG
jgi:hypothetical protein